jgi:site-specific DNA-methyltransferase (adenine-specific)
MKKLEIEYVDINSIKPYKNNAKLHPKEQIEQIKKSIEQFGMDDPIGIWKDEIVEGHGRLIACKELGYNEVPIIRLDHLTDEERKAYTLAHNKLTMNSDFDIDILNEELASFDDIDMSNFGFDMDFDTEEETEVIEDEVPEVPEEPKAKLGDIYQLGSHRLMCGDSTKKEDIEKLMNNQKANVVYTDPPYGMNLDTDYSKLPENKEFEKQKGIKGGKTYKPVIGDNEDFKDDLVLTIFNNFDYCKEIFVWGGDYYPELLKDYKKGNYIVWDKKSNEGMENNNFDKTLSSNFELCWSKQKHKKDIVRVLWVSAFGTEQEFDHKRHHPTQKPTKLSRWFIDKYSKENDLIVDIYGGSGSTLIACEQLNRKCYMMELDPHYIDVIIQRWENFTGEKAVKLN